MKKNKMKKKSSEVMMRKMMPNLRRKKMNESNVKQSKLFLLCLFLAHKILPYLFCWDVFENDIMIILFWNKLA